MYARVIVDIASSQVDKIFDYIAPNENLVGKRVFVPFAGRNIVGWVIEQTETTSVEKSKLKPILKVMDNKTQEIYPVGIFCVNSRKKRFTYTS